MRRAPLPEARANFPFTAYLATMPPQMSTSARASLSFMALVRFARKLLCSISTLNFRLSRRFALTDFTVHFAFVSPIAIQLRACRAHVAF
jgi:hypothetical protein